LSDRLYHCNWLGLEIYVGVDSCPTLIRSCICCPRISYCPKYDAGIVPPYNLGLLPAWKWTQKQRIKLPQSWLCPITL
jgi:hypothetical protein